MFDSLLFRPSLQTRESAQSQQGKATVADVPHGILGGLMVLKGNEMKMSINKKPLVINQFADLPRQDTPYSPLTYSK